MSQSAFFREIVEASVAVVVVGGDGIVSYVSPPAARYLAGDDMAELEGAVFAALFCPDASAAVAAYLESLVLTPRHRSRWVRTTVALGDDNIRTIELNGVNLLNAAEVEGLVITVSDVTDSRRREDELQRQATTDPLTGLSNRAALSPALDLLSRQPAGAGCVALLDLDSFKSVNDQYGHGVGDELLRYVGKRLRYALPEAAVIARVGGDEFVVVLRGYGVSQAQERLRAAQAALRQPVFLCGHAIELTATVGIAETDGVSTGGALVQQADMAQYRAKTAGGDRMWVYSGDDEDWERRRKEEVGTLRADLDRATREARTDALTGIPNTRAYHEQLSALDEKARAAGRRYAVVFFDADDFHGLNRARGDAAGDDALRSIAELLSTSCRAGDLVFRKGGEEFVTFLPDTRLVEAVEVAERARLAIERAGIAHGGDRSVVTVSAGVAILDPSVHPTYTDVIADAAQAMKLAKDSGRNCVRRLPAPAEHTAA